MVVSTYSALKSLRLVLSKAPAQLVRWWWQRVRWDADRLNWTGTFFRPGQTIKSKVIVSQRSQDNVTILGCVTRFFAIWKWVSKKRW